MGFLNGPNSRKRVARSEPNRVLIVGTVIVTHCVTVAICLQLALQKLT
jgi:hypothetical protein